MTGVCVESTDANIDNWKGRRRRRKGGGGGERMRRGKNEKGYRGEGGE